MARFEGTGTYQQLKEEPGILEDSFSHHSCAHHHLQGQLLVEMLGSDHKSQSVVTSTSLTVSLLSTANSNCLLVTEVCGSWQS